MGGTEVRQRKWGRGVALQIVQAKCLISSYFTRLREKWLLPQKSQILTSHFTLREAKIFLLSQGGKNAKSYVETMNTVKSLVTDIIIIRKIKRKRDIR